MIDLLAEFARHGVDALLVGGQAVALHGVPCFTKDADLWLRDTPENLSRATAALVAFGAPVATIEALVPAADLDVVWMGAPPARIDLLKAVPGGDFDRAWASRVRVEIAGVAVDVVSRDELIRLKRASGRPQDLFDAASLEQLRG
ncbi:MAG: hypothetical protein U0168_19140 [Nannocystaceae bacterium]